MLHTLCPDVRTLLGCDAVFSACRCSSLSTPSNNTVSRHLATTKHCRADGSGPPPPPPPPPSGGGGNDNDDDDDDEDDDGGSGGSDGEGPVFEREDDFDETHSGEGHCEGSLRPSCSRTTKCCASTRMPWANCCQSGSKCIAKNKFYAACLTPERHDRVKDDPEWEASEVPCAFEIATL